MGPILEWSSGWAVLWALTSAPGEEESSTEEVTFGQAWKVGTKAIWEAAKAKVRKEDCFQEPRDTQHGGVFRAY